MKPVRFVSAGAVAAVGSLACRLRDACVPLFARQKCALSGRDRGKSCARPACWPVGRPADWPDGSQLARALGKQLASLWRGFKARESVGA